MQIGAIGSPSSGLSGTVEASCRCAPSGCKRGRWVRACDPVQLGNQRVTNTNRGLGNASVSVSVAFAEDTDQVCDVLKGHCRAYAHGAAV